MALVLKDRVLETSNSSGTGTFTLDGAVAGFQTFSSAIGNTNTTYYAIVDDTEWEVGLGTVGAGTLARTTVYASSTGSKVNFSSGSKTVFCDYPASRSVNLDASGNVSGYSINGCTIDNTTIGATTPSTAAFTYASTNSTTSTTPSLSFDGSNTNIASGATVSGSYLQNILQNKSGTASASTNYVLSNDLGTDSTYYGEFGMNSSVYSSGTPADYFSLNNGIYYSGHDGDISVGSGNGKKLYLAWGTTGDKAHVINATGSIGLNTNITGTTNFGTSGQVLTSGGSTATPTWTTPATGSVTSVATAGTVNGITLTGGPITTTGTVTLGGTLDLSSPPAIGGTTPAAGTFTTLTANSTFQAGKSSTNYIQAAGGTTPYLISQGGTNAPIAVGSNGTGSIFFNTNGGGTTQAVVSHTTSAVNYINLTGAATTTAPVVSAQGSDTDIPLVLQPKGTGALQAQATTSSTVGGNARGANAVDWQMNRGSAGQVASGAYAVVSGGSRNQSSGDYSAINGGYNNSNQAYMAVIAGGQSNINQGSYSFVGGGQSNSSQGLYTVIGGGWTNSGTAQAAVTTQSATMNGTTAVTLSGSNASIKVGQYISGTSINGQTYVAAVSGTSLTLSQAASGSSTSTLSFYTPHGVVVGGGNNQATGAYSFIGAGGDAGTAANRNVASGDWSFVGGGIKNVASGASAVVCGGGWDGSSIRGNTASGNASAILGGQSNTASGLNSVVMGGYGNSANGGLSICFGNGSTTRSIYGNMSISPNNLSTGGDVQASMLVIGKQTTDATATVLTSNGGAASGTNQVILPNNSAYYVRGSIVAGVTGGGDSSSWTFQGTIKRGANAAATSLIAAITATLVSQDTGAALWGGVTITADTTNGGLAVTVTGKASTTIRWVCKVETTEMTY